MEERPDFETLPVTRQTVREIVRVANEQRPTRELRLIGNVIKRVRKSTQTEE